MPEIAKEFVIRKFRGAPVKKTPCIKTGKLIFFLIFFYFQFNYKVYRNFGKLRKKKSKKITTNTQKCNVVEFEVQF